MTVEVHRILAGRLSCAENFIVSPGREDRQIELPDYCFLVKHARSGRIVLWDTGLATHLEVYPPVCQKTMPAFHPEPPAESLDQVLGRNGVEADTVTDVVFSHSHWDHMQPIHGMFPKATAWLGPGTLQRTGKGYPTEPESSGFSELSDPEKRIGKVRELSLESDRWVKYESFDHAFDFFEDGSLLLCNAPGHCAGNLCAIATTAGGKVVLGGDCAHHLDLIDGTKEIGRWKREDTGKVVSMHEDDAAASSTMSKLRDLRDNHGHKLLLAHDGSAEWPHSIS